jgi:hypothetical protein
MAKNVEVSATCSAAYGKPMEEYGQKEFNFKYQFEQLEVKNSADVELAKKGFKDADYIQVANSKRKAAARAEQLTKELAERNIEAPERDEPEQIYKQMMRTYKLLIDKGKMSQEQAEQLASQLSGWNPNELEVTA